MFFLPFDEPCGAAVLCKEAEAEVLLAGPALSPAGLWLVGVLAARLLHHLSGNSSRHERSLLQSASKERPFLAHSTGNKPGSRLQSGPDRRERLVRLSGGAPGRSPRIEYRIGATARSSARLRRPRPDQPGARACRQRARGPGPGALARSDRGDATPSRCPCGFEPAGFRGGGTRAGGSAAERWLAQDVAARRTRIRCRRGLRRLLRSKGGVALRGAVRGSRRDADDTEGDGHENPLLLRPQVESPGNVRAREG